MLRKLGEEEIAGHEARLAQDGYTIVEHFLHEDGRKRVYGELKELHEPQRFGGNEFSGLHTKRVFNLFAKTRALDALIINEDLLRLVHSLLGPEAQLSIASTMEIFAGETAQAIHRDDAYFPVNPHPSLVVNTMWALTDFSEANGGTRIVPGSQHRSDPINIREPSIGTEMPCGSVLIWDGQLWHGGGANRTEEPRFGLSLNFTRGWLRQQENHYLSLDLDEVKRWPPLLQKLLGFDNCEFLGFVDGKHPMRAINPEVEADVADWKKY